MKISTKGRYALRLMLDLAQHSQNGYTALKDVAKRQNISKKYLEQIIPVLNRSDFLLTSRGFQGGYKLSKSPDKYTVADILTATEGSLHSVSCLENEPNLCQRSGECETLYVWKGLDKVINDYLSSITLQDILDNSRAMSSNNYII